MFNFIRKLFKALNSSGKSWQLTGAIVLAMFAGFLPSNSLILLDLLFLALILNVNFGLFLLFSVIFSGVGYLFDPLFESLGYTVLTNESLNGFFTTLYNSAMFRWSSFNYTLVTGSLLVSAVLSIPMYFILNKFVKVYRVQLGQRLNEWKLTKWMKLFNEEESSSSLFRWWGVAVFGGLAAIIIVFMLFLFDPLARIGLEKSLSYTLQSEVNIDDFSSSLSDLEVKISGVEVADKDKLTHNLVEVHSIGFDLAFGALMEKKVMIEELDIDALAFGTLRKIPAEPYGDVSSAEQEKAETATSKGDTKTSSEATPFALPNVDDILAKESLKSIEEAQKLRSDIKTVQDKWRKISSELKSSNDVDEIKADALALQKSLEGGDVQKILSAKQDIDKLEEKVKKLKSKYLALQKEFNTDQKSLNKRIRDLKKLPKEDIRRLKEKYSFNASGGANIMGMLINDEVGRYMKKALYYYEMLKPYIDDTPTAETKEVTPPRGQGRWIKYANLSSIPEVVIKNAKVNVIFEDDVLDVNMKDFSSNQKLYKKPMLLKADAKGESYKHIVAELVDDRRSEKAKLSFNVKATEIKTAEAQMQALVMKDMLTDATIIGEVVDRNIEAKSLIQVRKVSLQMPSQEFINGLLEDVTYFNVNLNVEGMIEKPSITVKTDLDRQLSTGLRKMASKASKKFETELTSGITKKIGSSTEDIGADLGDTASLLNSKQDLLDGINLDFTSSSSNPLKGLMSF